MKRSWQAVPLFMFALTPAAAQQRGGPWSIGVTTTLTHFGAAAADRSEHEEFSIRPSDGIAVGFDIARRVGHWTAALDLGYLGTYVEAQSRDVKVQERTRSLDRLRVALLLGRPLIAFGPGRVEARGGVTADHWSLGGEDQRTVTGGVMRFALTLPLGRVALENLLGIEWTAGPFRPSELPAEYHRLPLRTVTAGLGIRYEL